MSEEKTTVEAECDNGSLATLPLDSRDPDTLRAALLRENIERRRNECLAKIQTDVVKILAAPGVFGRGRRMFDCLDPLSTS